MSRIETLLQQMTLDEKISMLAGADLWHSVAVPRLGVPQFRVTDGPNGARGALGSLSPQAVCTPVGIALGATWNPDLVRQVGEVLADELKVKGAHILLAPTVNIHRTPIAGRNFECYSEDPFLSGMIAAAYIQGIQSKGVGACIKHFVANDQEFERNSMSSDVDERPLREIYLEPFRLAIRAAKPWAVMSSYNRVNGVYACENDHTLKDVLKGEWGFDGIVMSDWMGTYDEAVPAGGLDLEMPGPARWMAAEVVKKALASGSLTESALDDKVRRLLGVLEKAGAFENPNLQPEKAEDRPEHRAVMREAAREAIVLLKNEGVLPLKGVKSLAVIGPHAARANILGGGSSAVNPHYAVSPLAGIRARAGEAVKVETAPGCFIHRTLPAPLPETLNTPEGRRGLLLSIFDNAELSGEPVFVLETTTVQHGWWGGGIPNITDQSVFSARMEGFFTPQESGRHTLGLNVTGRARLYLDGRLLIDHWDASESGQQKNAELDLEAGRAYALKVDYAWQGDPSWRALMLGHLPPHAPDLLAEAEELARHCDAAVVVVGLSPEYESEGFDRADMKLPGAQDELIRRVAAVNPRTMVVLNAGSALEMPWLNDVPAVVQLWYAGQEQGNALADVLFGDANPSGKLPTTFPARLQDNPAYINYPGENGHVRYGEGIFVGYRYYDKKEIEPLFPFGHGLSYTTFAYSNLKLSAEKLTEADTLTVSVDVTNTGALAGKEAVQVYVRDVQSKTSRPEKELKAFRKVMLQPGETQTVTFSLDREAFWYFDTARNGWAVEPGIFEIWVGASSRDIRLKAQVEILAAGGRLHSGLTLRAVLNDPQGKAVLKQHLGDMLEMPNLAMVMDMTLADIAEKFSALLPEGLFEKIIEDLEKVE